MSTTFLNLVRNVPIKAPAKPVLLALADRADDQGVAFPSHDTLALQTGFSSRTVQRGLDKLVALKLITRQHRYSAVGVQTSSVYRIVRSEVESLVHQPADLGSHPVHLGGQHDHLGGHSGQGEVVTVSYETSLETSSESSPETGIAKTDAGHEADLPHGAGVVQSCDLPTSDTSPGGNVVVLAHRRGGGDEGEFPDDADAAFNKRRGTTRKGRGGHGGGDVEAAFSAYNEMARRNGLSVAIGLGEVRRKLLARRLATYGGLDGWLVALSRLEAAPCLKGEAESGWRADIDWLIKPSSNFDKLLEGGYGRAKGGRSERRSDDLHLDDSFDGPARPAPRASP